MNTDEAWDELLEIGVSEQTLQIVTCINGYRVDVLEDVLYAFCGYRTFEQLAGEQGPEHSDYPHNPGYLPGCSACESSCHCGPGVARGEETECVWSGHDTGEGDL